MKLIVKDMMDNVHLEEILTYEGALKILKVEVVLSDDQFNLYIVIRVVKTEEWTIMLLIWACCKGH